MKVLMKTPHGFLCPNSSMQWSPWQTFTSQTWTSQALLALKVFFFFLSFSKTCFYFDIFILYKSPLLTLLTPHTPLPVVGCIYAPDKVNPNIFQFYFNFSDIFHHTSMHPLFHDFYKYYLIFNNFISSFIVYQKIPLLEATLSF